MSLRFRVLILLLLFFVGTSYSQIRLGAIIGGNSTSLIGDTPTDATYSSKYGYSAGVSADIFIHDDVSILVQSIYSNKNTALQYEVDYQYEPFDSTEISASYLELPISLKVTANNNIAYIIAGVSLNMTLAAKRIDNTTDSEVDILNSFEELSVNANFGVGVQFNVGKPILFFELRYSQGLSNLVNSSTYDIQNLSRLKSNSIQLMTGVMFNL